MTKIGITLVLTGLRSGGAEKQLLWIASEIVALGFSCVVLELVAGERTERIESRVRYGQARGVQILRAPAGSGSWTGFWRLRKHIAESSPRMIWSWGLRADVVCYVGLFGYPACNWLTSIRAADARISRMTSCIRNFVSKRCDGIVSNTFAGFVSEGIRRNHGPRLWVLPNMVESNVLGEVKLPEVPPTKWVLVMLGNIKIMHKGYDLAIQVARNLIEKNFPFELRIAGRPDELPQLEALCAHFGVNGHLRFYGEVTHPEVFLKEGHLYLLLSRFEGTPNTLLEALNVGIPAITTEVGDLGVYKAQGVPFTIIQRENVAAAVSAVEAATAEWAKTRAAGERGRAWVQAHFSESASRAALRKIVDEVLKS
jgi:glycosyltransferase involved in cell wall biosynthesis